MALRIIRAAVVRGMVHRVARAGVLRCHEAIKVIEAWQLGFNLGNAVNYLCRAGNKPGADVSVDLKKALWYIERQLAIEQSSETNCSARQVRA